MPGRLRAPGQETLCRFFRDHRSVRLVFVAVLLIGGLMGVAQADSPQDQTALLIAAARAQIGVTRYYDSGYAVIASISGAPAGRYLGASTQG
jgi:uncharacterized protein YijF (DUF1287 family)